jgi:hypothetical protein
MKYVFHHMTGWLLFLYQLPAGRSAARLRLWRQLRRAGAVPFKSSTYLLPDTPEHDERLRWLIQQARADGADATILRVREIEGMKDAEVIHLFHEARAQDFAPLLTALRATGKRKGKRHALDAAELEKLTRQFEDIRRIDFFDSPAGAEVQRELARSTGGGAKGATRPLDVRRFRGRTWLTRPRPHIDRAASAWLIRRFIDPEARFVFATKPAEHPDALPFDMFEGEFTHHGDDCTFETLLKRFGLREKALRQIAEMVHEADVGDGKFAAVGGIGLDLVFKGWGRTSMRDEEIIERATACLDGLYQQLRK